MIPTLMRPRFLEILAADLWRDKCVDGEPLRARAVLVSSAGLIGAEQTDPDRRYGRGREG